MEVRRIQITGGSSFMITLPKSWADSVGLKKNDPVSVIPQPNGGLLLAVNDVQATEAAPRSINVDALGDPEALYRCLVGAYIAGHNQILIHSHGLLKGTFIQAISRFTQTSIGMEIVEEEEDHILIKDLMDHTEVIPQKNVRREYLLVKRMISDVLTASFTTVEELESRDTEVDRLHWLVQRQSSIHQQDISLSNKMGIDLRAVTNCVAVSKTLERMGDHAVLIARHYLSMDEGDRVRTRVVLSKVGQDIQNFVDASIEAWFDSDNVKAEQLICDKKPLSNGIEEKFSEISSSESVGLVAGSCKRIVEYCSDIAESAINLAMEKL